jgi:hypothetical protein
MDYETSTPDVIAGAIAAEIGRPATYRQMDQGATARVAERIAELL